MAKPINENLADAKREFRGAKRKLVSALTSMKDGLVQEGGALAEFIKSGKGTRALNKAVDVLSQEFREHRAESMKPDAGKKKT